MVFGEAVLEALENDLADGVRHAGPVTTFPPLPVDRYVAMSALQKAVRRGREDMALTAAANLLSGSVAGFWRRMIVIALEDVGVADMDLVGLVTVAASQAKLRPALGGEWAVAEYLIRGMCRSAADRSTDDLTTILDLCPSFEDEREELAMLPVADRIARAVEPGALEARALAAWFAVGTDVVAGLGLPAVTGCPTGYFEALREAQFPGHVVEVSRLAFRRTRCGLAVKLPLLHAASSDASKATADDEIPDERVFGPVPSWVFDVHTRCGLDAFSRYLKASSRMRRFVAEHFSGCIPPHRMIGGLVFRVESGLCTKRLQWAEGLRLRDKADHIRVGLTPEAVPEGLAIVREEIVLLNACRAEALPFYLR